MRSVNNSREIKEGPYSLTTYEIFDGLKSLKISDDVSMVDFLFSFTYLPDSLEIGRNVKFPQKFGYRSSYDYDRKEDRRPDFSYIYDMRSIKLTESEPSFWPTFTNRQYMTIKVYVPEGSLNNYVNAESWENFWHIVEYVKTDSGIDSIRKDENNDLPRFFNLSGIEIPSNQLAPGIYIRRQGTKVSKVVIK